MSNEQRKLIRFAVFTDLRGKRYSLQQQKYTRRKSFAANQTLSLMRCAQPLTHNAYLHRGREFARLIPLCSAYVFLRPRWTLWLGQRVKRGNAIMKLKGCFAETRSWQQGRSKYCCLVGVPSSHTQWRIPDAFLLRRRRIRKIDYSQADEDNICRRLSSGGAQRSPTGHIL